VVPDSEDVGIYLAAHHPSSVIWGEDMKKKKRGVKLSAGGEKKKKGWLTLY